ncbi:MAG: four helix bundle protein [Bacteroidia bacterium]
MKKYSYENLLVWQKAHQYVLAVYKYSENFPKSEIYGLRSQLRDSSASVPTNIVEGTRRNGKNDKLRFLNIAQASLDESHYQLLLAHDLGYGDSIKLREQADEINKMLSSFYNSILK